MNNNTVVLKVGEVKWYPEGLEMIEREVKVEAPDEIREEL